MSSKTTLADYLAELGVDINNMQEFLNKLSLMLTTSTDSVTINQTLQDGSSKAFSVPSFAYLRNRITALDDKFNSLLTGNANRVGVTDQNGQVRMFELQDTAQVVTDLDAVSTRRVGLPTNFQYKTNWFFESFLNPLLYIDVPVSSLISNNEVDTFEVIRVIVTSQVQTDKDYFDSTYKGITSISYSDLIRDLGTRGIQYFEDSNEISMPPAQNKRTGTFDILNKLSDVEARVVLGETLTKTATRYVLNTLLYKEKSTVAPNGIIQRTLKVGDLLVTPDNSEYRVTGVDVNQRSITVDRIFGLGELLVGAARFRIKPQIDPPKTVSINLGYNERQVVFLRPISKRLRVSAQSLSQGFGIYTNELNIKLASGESLTLETFYQNYVADFGLLFLNFAKEKKLPSVLGAVPNPTTLAASDFKVVQTNQHIKEADDVEQVKQNIASIESVKSEIREIDRQTSEKRAELNTNAALNDSQRLKLSKDLATLSDTRKTKTTQLSSQVSSVTTAVKSTATILAAPSYKIKGFWHIPDPKLTAHGLQEVVQFKVAYRVLSKTGTSEVAQQISFTDAKGAKVAASFSPWKEVVTKPRAKKYDALTGFYKWQAEDVANPEEVNSNQIEIPINKGEVIEIKVKSLSEAGWPDIPVESEWSNSIQVEFPADLQTIEDVTVISQQVFAEEARVNFQDELNSKGLDIHLGTAFTSRDKYFAHRAEDVASGFFSSDGGIIDLFSKLKTITDTITAIQTSISSGAGVLKVSIVDQLGNQVEVTNGQTVQIFAGYYKDQIKNTSGSTVTYDHGKVITNQYLVQLENTSQTPLQLVALLNGGTGELATPSDAVQYPNEGYHTSLRYDRVPIGLNNPKPGLAGGSQQIGGYQSSQVKGQIFYARAKSVNLSDKLVNGDTNASALDSIAYNLTAYSTADYQNGIVINSNTVPYAAGHYLPYDPSLTTLSITVNGVNQACISSPNIWNGTLDNNLAPVGDGLLSEFCVSVDHPDIKEGGSLNTSMSPAGGGTNSWTDIFRPQTGADGRQKTLPFSQAVHCEISEADETNPFGAKYFQQAAYLTPQASDSSTTMVESNYPIKQGFVNNDKYLIGRYTCGAYLYITPSSYQTISATSFNPLGTKRVLEFGTAKSIKIPLTFQYRCSDYLKYVGGFRVDSTSGLKNVKYSKKIGFDINLKDDVFSFDVLVSAQYEKETAVVTPITGIANSVSLSGAALSA